MIDEGSGGREDRGFPSAAECSMPYSQSHTPWHLGRRLPTWRAARRTVGGGLGGGLRGGEGGGGGWRRGILPCALVSGSKAEAATASRLPQSGRHDRVHSDPPAASHPRTGGRRRSRRVATPLRGTISTCGFGYVTCSCLLLQDYATVTRRLAAARTARSKGGAGDLANVSKRVELGVARSE